MSEIDGRVIKSEGLGIRQSRQPRLRAVLASVAAPEVVAGTAAQSLPSTRARDQDDGS